MADLAEELVARVVAEPVVDVLEAVQVEVDDRGRGLVARLERVLDPVMEQSPVGQASEAVVEGQVGQLGLRRASGRRCCGS